MESGGWRNDRRSGQRRKPTSDHAWRLQEAKARFSEVVRLARAHQPQRVTVHGREAVVVVAAEDYDRLQPPLTGQAIVDALRHSPLAEVEIERVSVKALAAHGGSRG
jgi:prevent-host-death family protein